jgi:hypothetical protein
MSAKKLTVGDTVCFVVQATPTRLNVEAQTCCMFLHVHDTSLWFGHHRAYGWVEQWREPQLGIVFAGEWINCRRRAKKQQRLLLR